MFADVQFSSSRVLSAPSTDLALQFIPWRQFGFSQLRAGNLAMWNPHIFGGTPYFAGFQSALLYPPNWLHLGLPLNVAINWIIALHVFAGAYFAYLWCRGRQISLAGSILAGIVFMFAGPYFLHIYAGHLPHLCVMVWTPLILLSIDAIASSKKVAWVLPGSIAVAMQILAGHPQYVYYTGIAMVLYAMLRLIDARHRIALVTGLVAIYVVGAALAATQLLPGIAVNRESIRAAGTDYAFASTFSLPPVNFITLIAPNFFGKLPMTQDPAPPDAYWGPGYLWEMSLFASITALVLAIYAILADRRKPTWIILAMVLLMLLLALGRHTPLYDPLYRILPYYASFRGTVKFAYLATLFIGLLAGMGFDVLLERRRPAWVLIASIACGCIILLLSAWGIASSAITGADGSWGQFLQSIAAKYSAARELFTRRAEDFADPQFIATAGKAAARSLIFASITGLALGVILFAARFRKAIIYSLVVLAAAELFIFARSTRATMIPTDGFPSDTRPEVAKTYEAWENALQQLPAEMRALNLLPQFANLSMTLGYHEMWGYDPLVLRRHAQLMAASQGYDPDQANQYLAFRRVAPGVFRMFRCGLLLVPDSARPVVHLSNPLPVATLVGHWVVLPSRDSILSYVLLDGFDAQRTVVLETDPGVSSAEGGVAGGSVEVIASTTDSLELRATLNRPAILLITNNFADGWRARSVAGNPPQTQYTIMPANYTLQAIALQAGEHHLIVQYAPRSFRIGAWISLLTLIALATWVMLLRKQPWRGRLDRQSLRFG